MERPGAFLSGDLRIEHARVDFRLSPFNPKKCPLKPHARRTFFDNLQRDFHLSEISPFSLRSLPAHRNAVECLIGAKSIVAAKFLKVFFVPF